MRDYDLLNAAEKLEYERLAGVYDDNGKFQYEKILNIMKNSSGYGKEWIRIGCPSCCVILFHRIII